MPLRGMTLAIKDARGLGARMGEVNAMMGMGGVGVLWLLVLIAVVLTC